jgi:hypothetical protein
MATERTGLTATEPTATTPTARTAATPTGPTAPTATARTAPTPTGPTGRTATEPTAPPEPTGLAALIGAAEAARFLERAFGREAFRTRIAPPAAAGLFGWERLNAALAEHRLVPPRLRLERAGRDVTRGVFRQRRSRRGAQLQDLDAAALSERLREGATLIVDAVNELSPPLQALCAGLSAEFAASCQANMYACWGVTQGFDVHWDDHEVFVVQVEGRKEWALYGATEAWPTRRGAGREAPAPDAPAERIVLEPGDVLYLPRGYWHAAVGLGGPTMHLTIGLTRKAGADFLRWLADELLAEEVARADLPFEAGEAAVGARIAELLACVAARDPQALARSYRRHVEHALVQRPQLCFPYIGEAEAALGPGARIWLAAGAARLRLAPQGLVLSWRGVEFTLSPALEPPLRRLLAGESVALAEIEAAALGAGAAEVQGFVREMARRGAFLVAEPSRPEGGAP